jgi:AcrR family transcriptional regulator
MRPARRSPAALPRRGRPRSQAAHEAVLAAALALVAEGGYSAATIDEISARSGVAKTTIYRRWPHRAALLVDLMLRMAAEVAPPPAGQDPLEALRTELHQVAHAVAAPPGRLLAALVAAAQQDAEVRDTLLKGLFIPRRKATARMILEAQRAGTVRSDVSPLVAVDLLFGPVFYRGLIRQEAVPPAFVRQLFEHALAGLGSGRAGASSPSGKATMVRRRRKAR